MTEAELAGDPWLTEQLGQGVYRLLGDGLPPDPADVPAAVTARLRDLDLPSLVYARVPVAALGTLQGLQQAGFRLVDTNLTLERPRMPPRMRPSHPAGRFRLRPARPEDEPAVVELARGSFVHSRFHLDPQIDDRVADELKAQWAASYFRGRRGDQLAVAETGRGIVGFLLAVSGPDRALVIDLVATQESHRGRGIAADLTRFAQEQRPDARRLRVGTQLANEAALRAYQRLGFTVARAAYVLHFHLPG